MAIRFVLLSALALAACSAFGQWEDVRRLGNGGETYVSTDGKGTVYASSHIPVQIYTSRNWGETFGEPKIFPDSLGDTVIFARPDGKAVFSFMYPMGKGGMSTGMTEDYGATWKLGEGIPGRTLDREWLTTDEKTGAVYMIYSDGYIGGPKSKGVFCAKSSDGGMTWKEISRVDKEAEGDYAIDPHIVSSSDGKLYAFWTTSSDYDKIDTYKSGVSTDGGVTWARHSTIANVTKKINGKDMDVQERWMLGGLAAYGEKEVLAFYMDFIPVVVNGATHGCLVVKVRYSHDSGMTWSDPQTVINKGEIARAAKLYYDKKVANENFAEFMQCLSWACFDSTGKPHFIWQDSRDGQAKLDDNYFNQWHVRHTWASTPGGECVNSERVSRPVVCNRPPLDFICCTADSKYLYVTWTEAPKNKAGWAFSGEFWFGRKKFE